MRTSLNNSGCKVIKDRYYLHNTIAQTNHSRIFLATDLLVNYRKCAVKQLHPSFCPKNLRSKIESAFLQEVAISKEIAGKHFQLCQFYNYFIEFGRHYLVQEWIDGTTLEQEISLKSILSESETKSIFGNLLLVLERVHSLGIVHNDIKPSNIILRSQDKLPVLIDFGVAKRIEGNFGQKIISGTPGYMSLEQAMGKSVFTNDLYSLGMTIIYLLTGRSPQKIDFNNHENNYWQRVKTNFDPHLVATIDRAISPQPQFKFNSAREMLAMWHKSPQISISVTSNRDRFAYKLESWGLILILAFANWWLYLNYFVPKLNSKPPVKIVQLKPSENSIIKPAAAVKPKILEKNIDRVLEDAIFSPGTTTATIQQHLGEPVWRKSGFWANSVAWSYEDVMSPEIDLGYIFDTRTHRLRQAEIAVPPTTNFETLKLAMNGFLGDRRVNSEIEQGLVSVYQRQQNTYNFATDNLKGIIQRNDRDRIYIGVWSADFH